MSELTKLRPTSDANLFPGYPMFQNATIGGQAPEGADAVNDLTYLCLSAQATVRLVQPNLTARIHRRSGRPYLHACANVIKMGMGFPSLFNDELIIFSLVNRGVKVEDAYNYCLVGCVEPSVQGKWGGRYGAGLTNLSKILEVTVHGGRDPRTGLALCPEEHDLSSFESFEPLMEAYSRQIQFYVRQQCIRDNIQDIAWAEMAPTPSSTRLFKTASPEGRVRNRGGPLRLHGRRDREHSECRQFACCHQEAGFRGKTLLGQRIIEGNRFGFHRRLGRKDTSVGDQPCAQIRQR